mgnify:CR=1 FL=1
MYSLYIVKTSGKLLHFTGVSNIDETAILSINRDDQYSVCKFSAESAYIEPCSKGNHPKTIRGTVQNQSFSKYM